MVTVDKGEFERLYIYIYPQEYVKGYVTKYIRMYFREINENLYLKSMEYIYIYVIYIYSAFVLLTTPHEY